MPVEEITIRVAPDAARAYRAATEEQRRKLDLLMSLKLREVTGSHQSLRAIMDEIGREAQARGLTAETVEEILSEA
jgi:hypothetical protein